MVRLTRAEAVPIAVPVPTTRPVEFQLNGKTVIGRSDELIIETDRVVKPPRDTRVLGLRLNALGWLATTD